MKQSNRSTGHIDILQRLWRALPEETDKLRPYVEKVKSYRNECGCAMGGVFLIGSLLLLVVDGLFFNGIIGGHWLTTALRGTAFAFGASIAGKATGIGVARIRLALMYRELRIRYDTERE
jgi:hypothetical protein